jgi:hypothetical protein
MRRIALMLIVAGCALSAGAGKRGRSAPMRASLSDEGTAQDHDTDPRVARAYSAPTTLKSLLTKTWCGQLTPIMWTLY